VLRLVAHLQLTCTRGRSPRLTTADAYQGRSRNGQSSSPFDEAICSDLQVQEWLERATAERDALAAKVPGPSPDPSRYCDTIAGAAGSLLRSVARSDVGDTDADRALMARRFSRARGDIRKILQSIVDRDEFFS
jgi:hypothetical protein